VAGVLLFAPAVLSYLPYRLNQQEFGLRRGLEYWQRTYESFLASPTHVHEFLLSTFGLSYINEVAWGFLFPGYVPLALSGVAVGAAVAAAAAFRRRWPSWPGRQVATDVVVGFAMLTALVVTAVVLWRSPEPLDTAGDSTTVVPWVVCGLLTAAVAGRSTGGH